MTREIEDKLQMIVACPFCGKEGVVDLDPYRDNATSVYKSLDAPATPAVPTYIFPAVIPTAAPPDPPSPPMA